MPLGWALKIQGSRPSWVNLSSCLGEALFGVTLAMDPQAGTHGLQILNAQKEDAGQYTCIVTNELGEATKNYHVEVLSKLPSPRGHWLDRSVPPHLRPQDAFPESRRQLWRGSLCHFSSLPWWETKG